MLAFAILQSLAAVTTELTLHEAELVVRDPDSGHTVSQWVRHFSTGAPPRPRRCVPPACSLLADPIRVAPGERLEITVYNDLPLGVNGTMFANTEERLRNTPKSYQISGIHTHGLHVSSAGGADDVFAPIYPGSSRTYVYDLPHNHGGGTFWIHPHWHSAESLQVGGGAAAPLIVTDPPAALPKFVDTMPELIVSFAVLALPSLQRITGQAAQNCQCALGNCAACADRGVCNRTCGAQEVQVRDMGPGRAATMLQNTSSSVCPLASAYCTGWQFDETLGRETHALELACASHPLRTRCQIGVGSGEGIFQSAPQNLSVVLTNGELQPTLRIDAEKWYRVRTVFAAVANNLHLSFCNSTEGEHVCAASASGCQWMLLAKDGVYLADAPRQIDDAFLAPGNRADFLLKCPVGEHRLRSHADVPPLSARDTFRQSVLRIDAREAPDDRLTGCALRSFKPSRPCYLVDLRDMALQRAGLSPSALFRASDNTSYNVTFEIHPFMTTPAGEHLAFAGPDVVDLTIPGGCPINVHMGGLRFHPSHQHINPVQLQSGLSNDGSRAYRRLWRYFQGGDWHDTVFLPTDSSMDVRYQTDAFADVFPHHCHILTHSDQGDWRNFRIAASHSMRWEEASAVDPTCYIDGAIAPPRLGELIGGTGIRDCSEKNAWPLATIPFFMLAVVAVHRWHTQRKKLAGTSTFRKTSARAWQSRAAA